MVIATPTTAAHAAKAARFTPTAVTRSFSKLLVVLAGHVEAERDIQHVSCWDPAFMDWGRQAERAREQVLSSLDAVDRAAPERPEDRPLQRIALLTGSMIRTTDAEEFAHLHGLVDRFPGLFSCAAASAASLRVNQMLATAKARLADLATLSEYVDAAGQDEMMPCEDVPPLAM